MDAKDQLVLTGALGKICISPTLGAVTSWTVEDLNQFLCPWTAENPSTGGMLPTLRYRPNSALSEPITIDRWRAIEVAESQVTLEGSPSDATPLSVFITFTLDTELTISLTTHNLGETSLYLDESLRFDLTVGDIKDTVVSGLSGATVLTEKEGRPEGVLVGDIDFYSPTTLTVTNPGDFTIVDPRGRNRISVISHGCSTVSFWNPWDAEKLGLPQPNAWESFLRISVGDSSELPVELAPEEVRTLSVQLSADALI